MTSNGELTHHQPSADDEPETRNDPPKSKPTDQKPEATMGEQPKPIKNGGKSLNIKEKQKQILESLRKSGEKLEFGPKKQETNKPTDVTNNQPKLKLNVSHNKADTEKTLTKL